MNRDVFNQAAAEEFEDAVSVHAIDLAWANKFLDIARESGRQVSSQAAFRHLTQDELDEYGEWAWAVEGLCPKCGVRLREYFEWGIAHGYGNCTQCGTEFKYYHRPHEDMFPLMAWALTGF